jgi:integrase
LERKYGADGGWIRDTRRGFVTRKIVSEGFDERLVMMQSGHRTRETVKRYRIDQLRDQARVMVAGPELASMARVV